MRQNYQRSGQKGQQMTPAAVANDARWMLEQLSLPVDPRDTIKARRERAIRRAGISPAKGVRLWYAQTCALLAHEYLAIIEAYKNHVITLERTLEHEAAELRALREAREMRERQYGLDIETPSRALGAVHGAQEHS